jgi:diaminopimelate decarboxylase/aspartate kinase
MTLEASFEASDLLGAPPAIAASEFVVLKFGGSSVASVERWQTIAGVLQNRLDEGLRPAVVHSAIGGVSDALDDLLQAASSGAATGDRLAAIRAQHEELAAGLGLDAGELIADRLLELEQLVAGVRLIREVSVGVRVRVMALGELMATILGAAFLKAAGLPVEWRDARELLVAKSTGHIDRNRSYLAAVCDYGYDPAFSATLGPGRGIVLTQGFIAANERGETVLLGRGGSDTSAAYIASRLGARRLEIWTDVPGMFSADPGLVPSARLLTALRYDEAQELASAGMRVLHPRCLSPVRDSGIPVFIRSTAAPSLDGTVVAAVTEETEPQVKAVCLKSALILVAMDSVGMWHQAGFLGQAFAEFARLGISVDLVSTSETNVTVSVDSTLVSAFELDALVSALEPMCRVSIIPDCAAVSLVGRKIRTILPRLATALEVFEEEKIHLVSQSANDLNLSFVIDEEQGLRLVDKLHASIIRKGSGGAVFGSSWETLFAKDDGPAERAPAWWVDKRQALLEIAEQHDNAYVYDLDTVRRSAASLKALENIDRVLYAVKANFNADIIRTLNDAGVDFECVSPGEIDWLQETLPGLDPSRILFTPNFAPRSEYAWGLDKGVQLTLDNLYPLEAWPELFEGARLFVRVDPGQGRGHHDHVRTAGVQSKFGIPRFELDELKALVSMAGATVVGVHAHSGSGILDPESWRSVAAELVQVARAFPDVEVIDLGGGLGIPEKAGDEPFDLDRFDASLADFRDAWPDYRLWIEPGRFLVAQSGVLLTHVTQVKGKGDLRYVGVGTGMNSLIRPALYGAYHEIVNLSRLDAQASETATVVGPICETGDRLGSDRLLPRCDEGDVMLIANTGAYGFVMSSGYNRRPPAPEISLEAQGEPS